LDRITDAPNVTLRLINERRTAIIKTPWLVRLYTIMKINENKVKIILSILAGILVFHCLIGIPFPSRYSDIDEVMQVFGGCILLVVPPVFLFNFLRRGAAHLGVSYFFQCVEIVLGICLLVSSCVVDDGVSKECGIAFAFGLLLVLHGAIRLPSKQQKKDDE
jgi:hypothetical protein